MDVPWNCRYNIVQYWISFPDCIPAVAATAMRSQVTDSRKIKASEMRAQHRLYRVPRTRGRLLMTFSFSQLLICLRIPRCQLRFVHFFPRLFLGDLRRGPGYASLGSWAQRLPFLRPHPREVLRPRLLYRQADFLLRTRCSFSIPNGGWGSQYMANCLALAVSHFTLKAWHSFLRYIFFI